MEGLKKIGKRGDNMQRFNINWTAGQLNSTQRLAVIQPAEELSDFRFSHSLIIVDREVVIFDPVPRPFGQLRKVQSTYIFHAPVVIYNSGGSAIELTRANVPSLTIFQQLAKHKAIQFVVSEAGRKRFTDEMIAMQLYQLITEESPDFSTKPNTVR